MENAKTRIVHRSAITGRFVSKAYAEDHPDITIRQVVYIRQPVAEDA